MGYLLQTLNQADSEAIKKDKINNANSRLQCCYLYLCSYWTDADIVNRLAISLDNILLLDPVS